MEARSAATTQSDGMTPSVESILADMRRMHPDSYTDGVNQQH
jgi:hypothetical protein